MLLQNGGNLRSLSDADRMTYYNEFCNRLQLDPLTMPFKLIELDGKCVMYADHGCVQQLTMSRKISHVIVSREEVSGVYIVTVRATDAKGRQTESLGAVPVKKEKGEWKQQPGSNKRHFHGTGVWENLEPAKMCNAIMHAETKAKRRATLDLVGLGVISEDELDTMSGFKRVDIRTMKPEEGDKKVAQEEPEPAKEPVVTDQCLRGKFMGLTPNQISLGEIEQILQDPPAAGLAEDEDKAFLDALRKVMAEVAQEESREGELEAFRVVLKENGIEEEWLFAKLLAIKAVKELPASLKEIPSEVVKKTVAKIDWFANKLKEEKKK